MEFLRVLGKIRMDIDEKNNCGNKNLQTATEKVNLSLNGIQGTEEMDITNSTPTNENISENNEIISEISTSTKHGELFEGNKDANLAEKEVECSKNSLKIHTNSSQIDCMESGNISININTREEDTENNKKEETTNIHEDSQPEKRNDNAENVLTAADSLMLSDSENEEVSPLRKRKKGKKVIMDSDLEDNSEPPISKHCDLIDSEIVPKETARSPEKVRETAKNCMKKAKFSSLVESESEPEDIIVAVIEKSSKADEKKKKISALIDSDTESEGSDDDRKEENIKSRNAPPKRVSAKVAMDQLTAIKSETQRLHRENYVSVPYHKPKQHTLQEFLTRKTITRPGAVKGSKLKMSKEELEVFAKHLEERAKEATEFFKSDSEDEKKEGAKILDDSQPKKEEQEKPNIIEVIQEEQHAKEEERQEEEGFSLFEDTPPQLVQISEEKENAPSTSNIKKILPDVDFYQSPSLKGDPNMLIDLDTGDFISPKPTGVDNLLQRFLKSSAKRKLKAAENINILSVENGKVEMQKVSLLHQDESSGVDQKPGSAYFKLKNDLKSIIAKKRREELLKRVQGTSAEKVETAKSCNDDEEEEEDGEFLEEKDLNELEEEVMDIDENEGLIDNEAEEDIGSEDESEVDSEIEADDEGDANDDDDDDDDDGGKDATSVEAEPKKSKSRIIAAFEDSDDEAESASKAIDDILTEPLVVENPPENQLWTNEEPKNSDDENELLGLCSGRFDATQRPGLTQLTQGIRNRSDIPSSLLQKDEREEERQDRNSLQKENVLRLESSDEEGNTKFIKTAKKNIKNKQKKKLGFSDDEDDAENVELENIEDDNKNNHDDNEDENENEEVVETYIDYDSEENEIEVHMNKNDRLVKAATFFEKEAELSESEWGSADEDEKDMDKYDIELGDEDQFDKQKIRTELEQIHLREMLDEDMRDVRKMKEMFLEDEDDVGAKRQRQFKWKHTENGFSLDNPNADNPTGNNPAGEGEDENEEMWRKMRHERESLLKENIENKTTESSPVPTIAATSSVTITKRITVVNKTKTQSSANVSLGGVDSPFLISKVATSAVRGSFLIRDKETLTKLASITKADSDGAAGVASGKSRNFVFATLSEEQMALKRKSSDLLTDDEDGNQAKKQKFGEVVRKKQLIDNLL